MSRKLKPINFVNLVNQTMNKKYQTQFPAVDANNFSDMAKQLRNAPDQIQNQWQDTMIDLIHEQFVKVKRAYESPFRKLHLGKTTSKMSQLLMADIVSARAYSPDADMEGYFEDAKMDIATQYVDTFKQVHFDVSDNRDALYSAFINPEAFAEYEGMIEGRMIDSLEKFDVEMCTAMLGANIKQGNIYLVPMSKVVDQATALAFTAKLKSLAGDMAVSLSPKYNLAGMNTHTPKDEGIIISDIDTQAITETYSLAWAFNKELLSFEQGGQSMTIGSDMILNGDVFALYGDRYAFEIREFEGFPKTTSKFFENSLSLKRWLHYWALYTVSFFNNLAAFVDSTKIDDSAVAVVGLKDGSTAMNKGGNGQVVVTSLTVTSGKLFDKFGTFAVTGATSADTYIDEKSGKIEIGKDETGSDVTGLTGKYVTVTWTSHLDATITATVNIKINS